MISFAALTGNDLPGPIEESAQPLTVISVSNPVGGTAFLSSNGVWFTPFANFNGVASFEYTVRDNGTTNGFNDFRKAIGRTSFGISQVNDKGSFGGALSGRTVEGSGAITGVATFTDNRDGFSTPNFNIQSIAINGIASIPIGGGLTFAQDLDGLRAILREWKTLGTYSQRINNLRGTTVSSLNPAYYLRNSGVAVEDTLTDDSSVDVLLGGGSLIGLLRE
jgi:hypothetical protein